VFRPLLAGTLRGCDPDRMILKKVVLSGYPVKVHKKKAVVRWMFFGPEDVRWFRPVELWTKHGRRGQIKARRPHSWLPQDILIFVCIIACIHGGSKMRAIVILLLLIITIVMKFRALKFCKK
jgi:hypothetical protein